jgi:acetylornithine deacetylase/succinyl-diaminopimelate desuccinylase-like protein
VTIPGFCAGVSDLPPDILAQWKKLDMTPESFLKPIGLSIPAGEKGRLLIEQVSSRPTCDINGIIGGYTGEGSKTVIPAEASAKVSFRLVEGQNLDRIRKAFRDYVKSRLPGEAHTRPRHRAGWIRPRRRQHPLAEREVGPQELPQGQPLLGADFGGVRRGREVARTTGFSRSGAAIPLQGAQPARCR